MVSCQIGMESREAPGFGAMQRTNSLGQMKQKVPPRSCEKGREKVLQNECLNLQERGQRSKGLLTVKYHSPQLISFIATGNNISSELKISPVILGNAWKML